MSDPQLERSVLEGKDREELFAIAEALGARPTSRAKKSDLITQILRATGVEEAPAEEIDKPRRTRVRKATTPANGALSDAAGGDAAAALPAAALPAGSVPAGSLAAGPAPAVLPAGSGGADPSGAHGLVTDGAGDTGFVAGAAHVSPAPAPSEPTGGGDLAATPTAAVPTGGADTTPGAGAANGTAEDRAATPGTRPAGRTGRDNGAQTSETGSAPGRSEGQGGDGLAMRGGGDNHAPANHSQSRAGEGPGSVEGPERAGGRSDGEPGNRRNRRRRGRDRDRGEQGGERELQGGQGQVPGGQTAGTLGQGAHGVQGGGVEAQFAGEATEVRGILDLRDEGYGFLRTHGYLASPDDVYVSISQVRRFALRRGDALEGTARPPASNEKYPALSRIDKVSDLKPEDAQGRVRFESLTPLFPDQKLHLELAGDSANVTARIVDLISPIGKGQRGLIVSPPKAGKTTVLKQIAHSIEANNPEVQLIVLLVDERPEEVTDMRRSVKGEVVASTFDRPAEEHTQVAELVIERAKRLVEMGRDVVIVLDGITRLARAYNLAQPATGRVMSGGIDTGALYPPKKFFGAARNIEEGGSLTILATALVETGSRMDEVIFEEFKGTGNMELKLDRRLAERRVYPAIDVSSSSTRHEELLFDRKQLEQVWKLRRVLGALAAEGSNAASLELLMDKIRQTKSNDEFLAEIARNPAPAV